ncbi:DEAD/DEAH box helicase family protein [Paenibacillus sp. L3-i20]|uniref:DEAD/DEAH box helicase n=1 Tax=Paenibacillus sp. L3-i20 TaxID=2905833 RepID=UPI002852D557|nr:DEAD/DEAH box helicase family protein [Paenibacillus sp. L3-i20]
MVAPRGFEGKLRDLLKEQGLRPEEVIRYSFAEPASVDFGEWIGPELRDYQQPAVLDVLTKDGGVLESPAGSGKTLMGFRIVRSWGLPTLWLTHTLDLLDQSAKAAKAFLGGVGEVGIIGEGKVTWGSGKLFVATVQTLGANPTLVATLANMVGVVVVDEAHHFPAQQFIEVAGKFPAKHLLGLTATPQRKDGLESFMYAGLGPTAHAVKRDGMYEAGALILPEVKFVYTEYGKEIAITGDSETVENSVDAGGEDMDYIGLLKDLTQDPVRAKLVAENILESIFKVAPKGGAVIVLADSVRYLYVLRDLVETFARARLGFVPRMAVMHSGLTKYTWRRIRKSDIKRYADQEVRFSMRLKRWEAKFEQYTDEEFEAWQVTPKQRKATMEQARGRQLDILFATSQLVKEGLDIPNLYDGHLATPQRGDGRNSANGSGVEQAIGRIMRPDPNNPDKVATWYDYVDGSDGTFYDQYLSRRKVYARLGITLAKKPRTQKDNIKDFLVNMPGFDLPL